MRSKVIRTLEAEIGEPHGLAWIEGKVWIVAEGVDEIYGQQAVDGKSYKKIKSPYKNPCGLTYDGEDLLLADEKTKIVDRVNMETGKSEKYLDLMKVDIKDFSPALVNKASIVGDIEFGQSHLWVAVKAGYSSGIYKIDVEKAVVKNFFFAPGPQPEGISFDHKQEHIWTVDARNREIRQFDAEGKWSGRRIESPANVPRGLSLDDDDNIWVINQIDRKIFEIEWED